MSTILALDTSNYTTSACIFNSESGVIWENRIMLKVENGACGIRQNDAVFLHTKNLSELFINCPHINIDRVAASNKPSEKENSYMPCFNVGVSFASSISQLLKLPLYLYSHQKNHIAAAAYSGRCINILNSPFIAYHISGGTTDILFCQPNEFNFDVEKIGGTKDISCGQLIDRVGTMLGYNFPCGKLLQDNCVGELTGKIKLSSIDFDYNFSGFQNIIQKMNDNSFDAHEICRYTLDVVYSFILKSVNDLRIKYGNIPVIFSGGVMSNLQISQALNNRLNNIYFSDPRFSIDNALGTAFLSSLEKDCTI